MKWLNRWTSWVGFRYLKSKKNSRFLSFITLLSIFGIALGVTSMIVVLSVMDGFEAELKKRLMGSDLHILITPKPEFPTFDQGFVRDITFETHPIAQELKSLSGSLGAEIQSVTPVLSTEAILRHGKKVSGVLLKGIPQVRFDQMKSQIKDQALPKPGERLYGLWIGQELAIEMGVTAGDEVALVSPLYSEGPMNAIPRVKKYRIEAVYQSGIPEQELHTLFVLTPGVESFIRRSGVLTQWEVSLKRFDQAPKIASILRQASLGQLQVKDWMELNAHLFASLKLERISMFIILAFIVVVASFNIVTTLTLMVLEKKREIAILNAMGASAKEIGAIFLSEGIFIGIFGVGLGLVSGSVICLLLRRYEFITLPDIYYDRTLPVTFSPSYYVGVAICALGIVLAACIYPSRRAGRMNPLDGIRYGS